MSKLYPLSKKLIESLPGTDWHADAHEPGDPASSDLIWIMEYSDGGMCEGEYLSISPSSPNSSDWYFAHNSADICGGHPTYWSGSGSEADLLPKLAEYVLQRACELNR